MKTRLEVALDNLCQVVRANARGAELGVTEEGNAERAVIDLVREMLLEMGAEVEEFWIEHKRFPYMTPLNGEELQWLRDEIINQKAEE